VAFAFSSGQLRAAARRPLQRMSAGSLAPHPQRCAAGRRDWPCCIQLECHASAGHARVCREAVGGRCQAVCKGGGGTNVQKVQDMHVCPVAGAEYEVCVSGESPR
jgi:hypothetical protein